MGNPRAGSGRGARAITRTRECLRAMGHEVVDVDAPTSAAARCRAEALAQSHQTVLVVAVGGDGAVNTGMEVALGAGVPLAIVPCGTGNDFASSLGLTTVEDGLATIGRWRTKVVDAGRITWDEPHTGRRHTRWFGGVVAAGFDAVVNERANQWRYPAGRARYAFAVVREIAHWRAFTYRLTVDGGEPFVVSSSLVAVGNTGSYGGGIRVLPAAGTQDGLLHLLVVEPISRRELLTVAPRAYRGLHVDHPKVAIRTCRSVIVEVLDASIVAYADGERIGPLPLTVTVEPAALTILSANCPVIR